MSLIGNISIIFFIVIGINSNLHLHRHRYHIISWVWSLSIQQTNKRWSCLNRQYTQLLVRDWSCPNHYIQVVVGEMKLPLSTLYQIVDRDEVAPINIILSRQRGNCPNRLYIQIVEAVARRGLWMSKAYSLILIISCGQLLDLDASYCSLNTFLFFFLI